MPATKDQIADAFQRHVEHWGYGRTSVEDVAAELGISKRTVYQHFSSKKDLYAYVVDKCAVVTRKDLAAMLETEPTYRAKMRRFLQVVVTGMRTHIQETTKADWMQEFEVAFDAMSRAYGSIATELIARGAEAGEFEFADAYLANEFIGAIVTSYGVLVRERPGYDEDDAVVAAIMRMLGGGAAGTARKVAPKRKKG